MNIDISTDTKRLDINFIHQFLTHSYWAKGRTKEEVIKSLQNCINFGVYHENTQIGFARVLTDHTVFAYIMDVFIIEDYRGRGFSKQLMQTVTEHPDLRLVKKWMLLTKDAHGLYEKFGFKPYPDPSMVMAKLNESS